MSADQKRVSNNNYSISWNLFLSVSIAKPSNLRILPLKPAGTVLLVWNAVDNAREYVVKVSDANLLEMFERQMMFFVDQHIAH